MKEKVELPAGQAAMQCGDLERAGHVERLDLHLGSVPLGQLVERRLAGFADRGGDVPAALDPLLRQREAEPTRGAEEKDSSRSAVRLNSGWIFSYCHGNCYRLRNYMCQDVLDA